MAKPITLIVREESSPIHMDVQPNIKASIKAQAIHEIATTHYRQLLDKPTINGTELYDNYDEIDPTVPTWAKAEEPEALSYAEICEIWMNN